MAISLKYAGETVVSRVRNFAESWWGGIGCRVAFIMSLGIFLVAAMTGLFLLWEGRAAQSEEIRGRALSIGGYFSALAVDDIVSENRAELYRKLMPAFLTQGGSSRDLTYLLVYNRTGQLLIGNTPRDVLHSPAAPEGSPREVLEDHVLGSTEPVFRKTTEGIFDLILPVFANDRAVGFVRVGISSLVYREQLGKVTTKAVLVGIVILLLGLLLSQILAAGIVQPISRLNTAVDELSRQNWKTPIPVQGNDELSRLATAFNRMATTLKQRETSLSQGNRDLFILHTTGLDLMETLDLPLLLDKIAARAEDLLKADTTTITAVNPATHQLEYLGGGGSRFAFLKAQASPVEAGGIFNWLSSYGTPLLIQDAATDFRMNEAEMQSAGIRSIMTSPLWSSNHMIAILTVVNKKGGDVFDKHDLRLFTVFSNLAGAALQNAFLYADLKRKMDELGTTQQQLIHSSKMAAIGELATNLAHEINNPLTSVLGYTSHLIKTLDVPDGSLQKLRLVEQETLRVRKIIRNLLDFSRQRASAMQPGDIRTPLRDTVTLLQGVAEHSSVRIREEYPASSVPVNMDKNELKQVFINIINNALQAMPQGGDLQIRVRTGPAEDAVIEFEDTGHGISQEHLEKIFEPFFSTKIDRDGTGLVLSISYRIIQNHGGRIEVESESGTGTLFRVVLPLYQHDGAILT